MKRLLTLVGVLLALGIAARAAALEAARLPELKPLRRALGVDL